MGSLGLACVPIAVGQALAPIADPVEQPLLSTGIMTEDVEMFGELVYLWTDAEQADVIHFVGDFELQLGARRLNAREAVIWMTPRVFEGTSYHAFEVFLWRDARVVEPAGTRSSGPLLFVTLSSTGRVRVSADKKAFESSADTNIFAEALAIRDQIRGDTPSAMHPFQVTDPGSSLEPKPSASRPAVYFRSRDTRMEQVGERRVVTAIGDVYVFHGSPGQADFRELRADAAVLYFAGDDKGRRDPAAELPADLSDGGESQKRGVREALTQLAGNTTAPGGLSGGAGSSDVEAVYLEGDVVLTWGERMIRASRLYWDLRRDQAVILDATFRTYLSDRNVPLYIRAERVRQLSAREFEADRPLVTTSEFHTPHYHIGASRIEFEDRTETELAGLRSGAYKMTHTTFNIGGVPLLYWPFAQGSLKEGEMPIRSVRTGYSGDFGLEVETEWRLFNVLGLATPVGFDGTLRLDYFSERGPGMGIDLDYLRDDYFGMFKSYYIHDQGEDNLGGRFRDEAPDTVNRGRTTFRHRQYLPDDWELTLEASYISDRNFLEEYFESEFDKGKEQETLFYLKKQRDNWAFTMLGQWRVLDFLSQTEHLPDLSFRLIGQPLGDVATLYSENRAGWVRYRPAEPSLHRFLRFGAAEDASGTTGRLDSRQEVDVPLDVGPVRLVPFGVVRGSAWDDSPADGGVGRVFGTGGVRGSMYLWRMYDVESDLWDVHGLRHVIKPDVTMWASATNHDSHELYPFDENVEDIDAFDGVTFGVRQRWQTKRGAPGRERVTDVFTLDVEAGFFNNAPNTEYTNGFASYSRPENSISRNYLNTSFLWRVNDATALISEANIDLNDGELDVFNLSYVVERTPRFSYLVGYRFIGEIDSNLIALGANYRLSEKHSLAIREEFDLDRGQTHEFSITFIRRLPRWYMAFTFDLDEVEDDMGLSMSVWPEGFPRAALGSRRFTGVATSTAIRPE